jgi:hypothetical protein
MITAALLLCTAVLSARGGRLANGSSSSFGLLFLFAMRPEVSQWASEEQLL